MRAPPLRIRVYVLCDKRSYRQTWLFVTFWVDFGSSFTVAEDVVDKLGSFASPDSILTASPLDSGNAPLM